MTEKDYELLCGGTYEEYKKFRNTDNSYNSQRCILSSCRFSLNAERVADIDSYLTDIVNEKHIYSDNKFNGKEYIHLDAGEIKIESYFSRYLKDCEDYNKYLSNNLFQYCETGLDLHFYNFFKSQVNYKSNRTTTVCENDVKILEESLLIIKKIFSKFKNY